MVIQRKLRCSFCLKPEDEVAKLVSGPGSLICDGCVQLAAEIIASDQPSNGSKSPDLPAWSTMPDEQLLARLPLLAETADRVEDSLAGWVAEARRRGSSWARIGAAMGVTRQSAWTRFASTE
ncbi:ClpX C4-type zinc finger protein [Microlunatus speluncae]|uniref:ClpX C4-type zinc finger protein n=1 Tax=Microlunatus speluncae TaxID=2594267 RepID=UPI0012667122|nr:ClpX C4-type zinc finger protein [Microlunatus speluncae]